MKLNFSDMHFMKNGQDIKTASKFSERFFRSFEVKISLDPCSLTSLTFRFWPWMNPLKPLDQVKNYFGEQIGLYFAFIGYYTFWLTWIALFGLGMALESHFSDCLLAILLANEIRFWAEKGTFIYGLVTMNSNTFIQEIKDDSRYLCPRCDQRNSIFTRSPIRNRSSNPDIWLVVEKSKKDAIITCLIQR